MTKSFKPITNLTCMVRVYDESSRAALDQALAIAQHSKAHLIVMIAAAKVSVPFSPAGAWFASPLVGDLNHQTMTKAKEVAQEVSAKAMAAGISADIQIMFDHVENVAEKAIKAARISCRLSAYGNYHHRIMTSRPRPAARQPYPQRTQS